MGKQAENVTYAETENTSDTETVNPAIQKAYDLMIPMISAMYKELGKADNCLYGLVYDKDEIIKVAYVNLEDDSAVKNAPLMIQRMLQEFPVVVHVFEAWLSKPGAGMKRLDIVGFIFNTEAGTWAANCFSNPKEHTFEKVSLQKIEIIGGTQARTFQTLH